MNKRIVHILIAVLLFHATIPYSYALSPLGLNERSSAKQWLMAALEKELAERMMEFWNHRIRELLPRGYIASVKSMLEALEFPEGPGSLDVQQIGAEFDRTLERVPGVTPLEEQAFDAFKVLGVLHAVRAKKTDLDAEEKRLPLKRAAAIAIFLMQMGQFSGPLEVLDEMAESQDAAAFLPSALAYVDLRMKALPSTDSDRRADWLRVRAKILTCLFSTQRSKIFFDQLTDTLKRLTRLKRHDLVGDVLSDFFRFVSLEKLFSEKTASVQVDEVLLLAREIIPFFRKWAEEFDPQALFQNSPLDSNKAHQLRVLVQIRSLQSYFSQLFFSKFAEWNHQGNPEALRIFMEELKRGGALPNTLPDMIHSAGVSLLGAGQGIKIFFRSQDPDQHRMGLQLLFQLAFNGMILSPEDSEGRGFPFIHPIFEISTLFESLIPLHPDVPYREYQVMAYTLLLGTFRKHEVLSPTGVSPLELRIRAKLAKYEQEAKGIIDQWSQTYPGWEKLVSTFTTLTDHTSLFHPQIGLTFLKYWGRDILPALNGDPSPYSGQLTHAFKRTAVLRQAKYARQSVRERGPLPEPGYDQFMGQLQSANSYQLAQIVKIEDWEFLKELVVSLQETMSDENWEHIQPAVRILEEECKVLDQSMEEIRHINRVQHLQRILKKLPEDHSVFKRLAGLAGKQALEDDDWDEIETLLTSLGEAPAPRWVYREISSRA